MLPWKEKRVNPTESRTDTLSRLLEKEQRLVRQIELAREEAAQILRQAGEYARRIEEGTAATIEERVLASASQSEQRLDEELERIRTDASREVQRFEDIDAIQDRELVRLVLRRILDAETTAEPSG
jgi:vacuolar-type H+-ATPase subunit H